MSFWLSLTATPQPSLPEYLLSLTLMAFFRLSSMAGLPLRPHVARRLQGTIPCVGTGICTPRATFKPCIDAHKCDVRAKSTVPRPKPSLRQAQRVKVARPINEVNLPPVSLLKDARKAGALHIEPHEALRILRRYQELSKSLTGKECVRRLCTGKSKVTLAGMMFTSLTHI